MRAHADGRDRAASFGIQGWGRVIIAAMALCAAGGDELDLTVDMELGCSDAASPVDHAAVAAGAKLRLRMGCWWGKAVAAAAGRRRVARLGPHRLSGAVAVAVVAAPRNEIVGRLETAVR